MVVTLSWGYNLAVDKYVMEESVFSVQYYMKRVSGIIVGRKLLSRTLRGCESESLESCLN